MIQHTLQNNKPKDIDNNLGLYLKLWTWHITLKCHWQKFSILKSNSLLELQGLLKHNSFLNKFSCYWSPQFSWGTTKSKHALCWPLLPSFPTHFVHVRGFYKMDCASLIEIKVKLTQTLESSIACWQHLDVKGPLQDLTNGATNPNTSHETKNVKIMVMVHICLSSLIYASLQQLKQ